jgi:acyl-coenzyme A thioesterase PaaI-like protein
MRHPETHLGLDRRLCGEPVALEEGTASVRFVASPEMAADDRGLVHGGFVFGLADHAAMLAVNHPLVVLGSAEVRFLAPVRVGDEVTATATRTEQSGRKHVLRVSARVGEREVLSGTMTAFVLGRHVLDPPDDRAPPPPTELDRPPLDRNDARGGQEGTGLM